MPRYLRLGSPLGNSLGNFLVTLVLTTACFSCGSTVADDAFKIVESTGLTNEQVADGWIALFDGESLFGWKPAVDANFRIEDGTVVVDEGGVGLLRTTCQFGDFELHVEFKADASTNSGIFIRTPPKPRSPAKDCYEINIAPSDNPFPTAGIVNRTKAEGVDLDGAADTWHAFDITAEGNKITVQLDGKTVTEYTDESPLGRGYIGLQHNKGRVAFRNVRLRPLKTQSLFDGQTLDGWKTYPEMEAEFTVVQGDDNQGKDGVLHVAAKKGAENGRGQLETKKSYGDFVLQLECMTHAPSLNSGIFFRCIPGDTMMGYESQIHNGFKDGDRTKPADCGTGGIFRRKNARRVVADDQAWFAKTLIVEGPHVAAWVNGYQVSDWSDTRKPHENPRKGLRLKAGTLMIQGHDPTTDISFRNLKISEVAPRRAK